MLVAVSVALIFSDLDMLTFVFWFKYQLNDEQVFLVALEL
jgi:hypothetical protein